jgi:cytochrome c553
MKNAVNASFIGLAAILLGTAAVPVAAQSPTGDAKVGAQRAAMCAGCHGISGLRNAYPEVFHFPKIGNQHPEYILSALQAYRSGTVRRIAVVISIKDVKSASTRAASNS